MPLYGGGKFKSRLEKDIKACARPISAAEQEEALRAINECTRIHRFNKQKRAACKQPIIDSIEKQCGLGSPKGSPKRSPKSSLRRSPKSPSRQSAVVANGKQAAEKLATPAPKGNSPRAGKSGKAPRASPNSRSRGATMQPRPQVYKRTPGGRSGPSGIVDRSIRVPSQTRSRLARSAARGAAGSPGRNGSAGRRGSAVISTVNPVWSPK